MPPCDEIYTSMLDMSGVALAAESGSFECHLSRIAGYTRQITVTQRDWSHPALAQPLSAIVEGHGYDTVENDIVLKRCVTVLTLCSMHKTV